MNNNINSICNCGKSLSHYKEDLATILPCNHLIHSRCINKINLNDKKCLTCGLVLTNVLSYSDLKK